MDKNMGKFKKLINKNKKVSYIIAGIFCLIVVAVIVGVFLNGGSGDRKRATKLAQAAEKEIASIKKDVPKMDRDTFITVDNKVVVGFVSIPDKDIKYPVVNVFDKNTYDYSLCRNGDGMPWDLEGMTVYGIDSFTDVLEEMNDGEKLVFEDVAGKKYTYRYKEQIKEKAVDYGIRICKVDESGKISEEYWFVKE